jgi:hypothetical protein
MPARHPQTGPRRWREAKRRPVPGNSPNDRMLRGPDCYRPKRVCADFFPATPSLPFPGFSKPPGMRFFRHAESIGPLRLLTPEKTGAGVPPPVGRPRAQLNGRDGRSAPRSSSAMSSDRLFLERVARQQSPSLLHRQPQHNTHLSDGLGKGDISTLHEMSPFGKVEMSPSFQTDRSHSLLRALCGLRRNPSRLPSGARKTGARP